MSETDGISKCCSCGFEWRTDQDGSHSCVHTFELKMIKIKEKLSECRQRNPISRSLKELDVIVNGDQGQLRSAREVRNTTEKK